MLFDGIVFAFVARLPLDAGVVGYSVDAATVYCGLDRYLPP